MWWFSDQVIKILWKHIEHLDNSKIWQKIIEQNTEDKVNILRFIVRIFDFTRNLEIKARNLKQVKILSYSDIKVRILGRQ